MITEIRSWMTAVVAVSLLISLVQSLIPKGSIQKIASLMGGLLLLIVLLSPFARLNIGSLHLDYGDYSEQIKTRQEELTEGENQEMEKIIAEKTQAYISDKATELGFSCTATVTTQLSDDGIPYPYSAEMSCAPSEQLAQYLAQELGIPKERQIYHGASAKK